MADSKRINGHILSQLDKKKKMKVDDLPSASAEVREANVCVVVQISAS